MGKSTLREDAVIAVGKSVSLSQFIMFFEEVTSQTMSGCEFQPWLRAQAGKTLKEAVPAYCKAAERKSVEELMSEERFTVISDSDKAFILAFDKQIGALGYDSGGGIGDGYCWGKYMIIYTKTGASNKKVAARIFIREAGIVLRLFFNNVDRHGAYIENAPKHIKDVFTNDHGNCGCRPRKENCRMRKVYTVDGKPIEKCSGVVFEFWNPTVEKLPDYMDLLAEFYPIKKPKPID